MHTGHSETCSLAHAPPTSLPLLPLIPMMRSFVTGATWKVASNDEGLSQKQVAEELGLSKQTLHDLWHRKSDASSTWSYKGRGKFLQHG